MIMELLQKAFLDVKKNIDGTIIAKRHIRLKGLGTCAHERRLKATDIWACINDKGYLVSEDSPIRYEEVVFCQRCEKVFSSTRR